MSTQHDGTGAAGAPREAGEAGFAGPVRPAGPAGDVGDAVAPRRRVMLGWDLGVAAAVIVMGLPGGVGAFEWGVEGGLRNPATGESAAGFGLAVGVLVGFIVLYALLGRAALRRAILDDAPPGARGLLFAALLVLLLGCATAVNPSFATLQALAYPMLWTLIPRYGHAVLASGVLAVATGVGSAFSYSRIGLDHPLWTPTVVAVISFVFSVVLGTWITRIFAAGERHRALAEQLRASQAEVAALSEQAGAAAERERLSRELHDTLTQTLAGLVMLSEQADRALAAADVDRARDRLARVDSAAREAVREARALVATTQPLGDGGLEAAIERVVARLRADTGLDVSCELEPAPLDRERQVVLLRAVQEGLANARRHARASRVRVSLEVPAGGGALLRVDDDGVGAGADAGGSGGNGGGAGSVSPGAGGGFGLSGLAARVRGVGGEVEFGASPLGGARLEVRLGADPGVEADAARGGPGVAAGAAAAAGAGAGAHAGDVHPSAEEEGRA